MLDISNHFQDIPNLPMRLHVELVLEGVAVERQASLLLSPPLTWWSCEQARPRVDHEAAQDIPVQFLSLLLCPSGVISANKPKR